VVWETAVERLWVAEFVRRRWRCDYGDGGLEESESRYGSDFENKLFFPKIFIEILSNLFVVELVN